MGYVTITSKKGLLESEEIKALKKAEVDSANKLAGEVKKGTKGKVFAASKESKKQTKETSE